MTRDEYEPLSFGTTSLSPVTTRTRDEIEAEHFRDGLRQDRGRALADVGRARQHDDRAVEIELDLHRRMRLAGPVHRLGGAADIMRAGHVRGPYGQPLPLPQLAFAFLPAALALDPVEAFRQAVGVHHQVVVGEGRRRQQVGAPHRERIEAELDRHLVDQALEGEADVDGAVAAEGAAGRRIGEHAAAGVFDVVQVVDGVEHRAGIEDRHHAVAGMRAAALVAVAFDRGDAAVLAHADLELDVGLGPAAMGDEGLLARRHHAHGGVGLARQQRGDQLDIERLGAAAEAAADMRLDHADARHVHAEDLRQHQVHVIGDLRRGMHGHAVAHGVVFGDRGVHLHLVLADLGAIVGAFAHEIGLGEALRGRAELEQHVALDIAGLLLVQERGAGRERVLRRVIGRQLLHGHLDAAERLARGVVVDRGDGRDRLAAVAHSVARQRIFGARDRQHAEALVAVGAGDDGDDARHFQRLRHVDVENVGVRIGAAVDAAGELPRLPRCRRCIWRGRTLSPARRSSAHSRRCCARASACSWALRFVIPGRERSERTRNPTTPRSDHGFRVRRFAASRNDGMTGASKMPHGATPCLPSATANFTASMIFT